jgi:DNA (cytosine-5)-methyltransferase 1
VRPRLLDLFCGAGGAAMGYHRAGFEVVGVDIRPQPNYPFEFYQGDALEALAAIADGGLLPGVRDFDAVHASPPCQGYSAANNIHQRTDHPLLIDEVRALLIATGLPYVIENVEGARANMPNAVTICGLAFGLNVRRHRLFDCNFPVMVPGCTGHDRDYLIVFGQGSARTRAKQIGRTAKDGPILRRGTASWEASCEAMGIDWMRRPELSEAIPPAYTEHIGSYLLLEVDARAEGVAA